MKSHTHGGIILFIFLVIFLAGNGDNKLQKRIEVLEQKIELLQKAQQVKIEEQK